jgi:hypothetical protein
MATQTDFEALRRDVQYLKDRTAILDCIARHSRGCDRHDLDLIAARDHPTAYRRSRRALRTGMVTRN